MSARGASLFAPDDERPWLFGRRSDLLAFGGSAVLSLALLGVGAATGLLDRDLPEGLWVACVLGVDVAHVWTTAFRVYLDPAEVLRRPLLYLGAPAGLFVLGTALHAFGSLVFWRVLAYAAVFHFVRQQAGFVRLYQRRERDLGPFDRALDEVAVYTATLYPLAHWHAHLPRAFAWFVPGDFVALPGASFVDALAPVHCAVLFVFLARTAQRAFAGARFPTGKVVLVTTTWLTWWIGIVVFDSDYAFTVTNVFVHGVPYMVLTYRYGRAHSRQAEARPLRAALAFGAISFLALTLSVSFAEELLWDRLVFHDRSWLFGEGYPLSADWLDFLVPLLALPQATHYLLDGFVWRARGNPALSG